MAIMPRLAGYHSTASGAMPLFGGWHYNMSSGAGAHRGGGYPGSTFRNEASGAIPLTIGGGMSNLVTATTAPCRGHDQHWSSGSVVPPSVVVRSTSRAVDTL
jgi:hypothetical protein